jgi:hypothetical protein
MPSSDAQFISSRVRSMLPHLPAFSGLNWFQNWTKSLRTRLRVSMLPTNFLPMAGGRSVTGAPP